MVSICPLKLLMILMTLLMILKNFQKILMVMNTT
jgi:hypothetical protein